MNLARTAVLERMSGPLCEAVLELPGSAATLAELARSNLLLVPLDRQGRWYRYHHLFRDMLLAELGRQESGLIPVLHRRAAQWFERNGLPEEALEHSMSAADVDMAARLVQQLWLVAYREAQVLAEEAGAVLRRAKFEGVLACAVQARTALHRGDIPAARQHLVTAQRIRPTLTRALPHLAVQARIELARAHLGLADIAAARTLMREVDEILQLRPALGTLTGEARARRARLAGERGATIAGASALTAAELRVLPMLATHLSFPEIGAEMFLSPHTVKSQAASIYRKLEASSRSQAVARSRELGLLEG